MAFSVVTYVGMFPSPSSPFAWPYFVCWELVAAVSAWISRPFGMVLVKRRRSLRPSQPRQGGQA